MKRYHFVLTLAVASGSAATVDGVVDVRPGGTRSELFHKLIAEFGLRHPQFKNGAVVFFSLDSDEL